MSTAQVVLSPLSISGAIQPSVPVTPDLLEKDMRPSCSFLQRPKSEIMARTSPRGPGTDSSTLCGLMSLCTVATSRTKRNVFLLIALLGPTLLYLPPIYLATLYKLFLTAASFTVNEAAIRHTNIFTVTGLRTISPNLRAPLSN
jgi:hypothetical protein